MPFLGRDWRSPGEQWVRTTEGWERLGLWRMKLFENLNENVLGRTRCVVLSGTGVGSRKRMLIGTLPVKSYVPHETQHTVIQLLKLASCDYSSSSRILCKEDDVPHVQSYVVVKEVSKEQSMKTTIAEALTRLDMEGAVRNHRRFNYASKLLLYLIQNKLSSLSGMAQKIVFNILQEIVVQSIKTNQNERTVIHLLEEMSNALHRGRYDHVGSGQLWSSHMTAVEKLKKKFSDHTLQQREEDGGLMITDMPDDVLRLILTRLSDHRDLVNTGLTDLRSFSLTEENSFWRNLCLYHFTNKQWLSVFRRNEDIESIGWKKLYSRLMKRYGMKEVYVEMLHLCRHCNALFWQTNGHPCPVSNVSPVSTPVSPETFVSLLMG